MTDKLTLISPHREAECYVVTWYAHSGKWVEVARLPNNSDAKDVVDMFNGKLSSNAIHHGEYYAYFRLSDFDEVLTRPL